MTDEFAGELRRERLRRDARIEPYAPLSSQGSPAIVGSVTTASTTSGKFLKFHPCSIVGTVAENGAATVVIRTGITRTALFIGPGTAVAGDLLIVRSVANRWVCEKPTGSGTIHHTIPGCPCTIPSPLTMSVVNPSNNFGMFQNTALVFGSAPPGISALGLPATGFYSPGQFLDNITLDRFWYRFFCSGAYFCISRVYATSVYGSPFADAIRYRWYGGLPAVSGNSCSPFLMSNGVIFAGGDPATTVTISE